MASGSLTLSTLAPEILCQIFQALSDFTSISVLTQTSHIFYRIWSENPISICSSVAPRVISNLDDAWRLVDAQKSASAVPSEGPRQDQQDRGFSRANRLLFNARCEVAACESWNDVIRIQNNPHREEHLGKDPYMRPSERARFEHAFYSLWTICVLASTPHLHYEAEKFLNGCSPRELYRLTEMEAWASYFNENDFRERLGLDLDFRDKTWRTGCKALSKRWLDSRRGDWGCVAPHDTNFGFFVLEDPYQRYLDFIPGHW